MVQDKSLGLQTNRLILDLSGFPAVQLQHFVEVFPSVRTFYIRDLVDTQDFKDPRFQPWRDSLEVIIEERNCAFAQRFLESGTCSSLKSVSFRRLSWPLGNFACTLENTPNLQSLELSNTTLTLQELDTLHSKVPLLKRLVLLDITIRDDDYPTNIVPASKITSFSLGIVRSPENHEILRYMGEKYINLVECSLHDKYSVRFIRWDYDNDMLNRDTFSYFFEKTVANLRSLDITLVVVPTNFSELLDNANSQIQKLTIGEMASFQAVTNLSTSKQTACIQSLTITNIEFNDYSFLKGFIHVKELRLAAKKKTYRHIAQQETDLNALLCIDSLELFELQDFNLSCALPSCVYSLKHLALKRVTLPKRTRLDRFLSTSCPHLHYLKLFNCGLRDIKSDQFDLPRHRLSYLGIRDHFHPHEDYILLVTDNEQNYSIYEPQVDNVNRHFHLHDRAVQRYNEPIPYSSMGCEPFITFQCRSVDIVMVLYADPVYSESIFTSNSMEIMQQALSNSAAHTLNFE
jgi:hypothetical protein